MSTLPALADLAQSAIHFHDEADDLRLPQQNASGFGFVADAADAGLDLRFGKAL